MKPSWKFNPPHFTLFTGDEDPDRHLMHYRSVMTLYANDDAFMCKIFTMNLQGEKYLFHCSIKKKSDHLFNMKKYLKESLHTYAKRFKAEKAKIIGCDDSIPCSAFRKGFPADHLRLKELIMGENLSLENSYALAEKHSLWDEEKRSQKLPKQPCRVAEPTQKKASDKPLNIKSKPGDKRKDRSPSKGSATPKTHTRFTIPISQILRDLKK
ncbi:hypothetical protein ACFXTN_012204 [Malus domestica]